MSRYLTLAAQLGVVALITAGAGWLLYPYLGTIVSAIGCTAIAGFGMGFCCCDGGGPTCTIQAATNAVADWTQTAGTWADGISTSSASAQLTLNATHPDGIAAMHVTGQMSASASGAITQMLIGDITGAVPHKVEFKWGAAGYIKIFNGSGTLLTTTTTAGLTPGSTYDFVLCVSFDEDFIGVRTGSSGTLFAFVATTFAGSPRGQFALATGATLSAGSATFTGTEVKKTESGCEACDINCTRCTTTAPIEILARVRLIQNTPGGANCTHCTDLNADYILKYSDSDCCWRYTFSGSCAANGVDFCGFGGSLAASIGRTVFLDITWFHTDSVPEDCAAWFERAIPPNLPINPIDAIPAGTANSCDVQTGPATFDVTAI